MSIMFVKRFNCIWNFIASKYSVTTLRLLLPEWNVVHRPKSASYIQSYNIISYITGAAFFIDITNYSENTVGLLIDIAQRPGKGNWVAKSSTLRFKSNTWLINGKSGAVMNLRKSWSFGLGDNFLASWVIFTPSCMKSATNMKSFSVKPLVVRAGVPMRMPPGTIALLSPITVQIRPR